MIKRYIAKKGIQFVLRTFFAYVLILSTTVVDAYVDIPHIGLFDYP